MRVASLGTSNNKVVLDECNHVMCIPIVLNIVNQIFTSILLVFTANTIGLFADAAFQLDLQLVMENFLVLGICIVLTVIVAPGIGMISDFVMLKKALIHDNIIFGHFFKKKTDEITAMVAGELQYELEDAPNELRIQYVSVLSKALSAPFCLGYLLFCTGHISWLLTGFMLLLASVRLAVPIFFRKKLAKYDANTRKYFAKRRGSEMNVSSNLYVIKLWGITKQILDRLNQLFINYYTETGKANDLCKVFAERIQTLTNEITQILLFIVGAIMVALGRVTPGEFAAVLVYFGVTQTLLSNISEIIKGIPLLKNAQKRVCDFYDGAEHTDGFKIDHVTNLTGCDIRVSVEGKVTVNNACFTVNAGEKIAILGENGSGKTTLAKVIASLIQEYDGKLYVNDYEFQSINLTAWRNLIAYAPQSPYLFAATVNENIWFENSELEDKEKAKMLEAFGLTAFSNRIVSSESDLSGGEKQKVSIARAITKPSEVLILDEPTNHLDANSVNWLKEYIEQTERTVIVVTHDSALLQVVDKTLIL